MSASAGICIYAWFSYFNKFNLWFSETSEVFGDGQYM